VLEIYNCVCLDSLQLNVAVSDAARPLSYKTKTSYFFKTKTGQAKTNTAFSRPRPLFKPSNY